MQHRSIVDYHNFNSRIIDKVAFRLVITGSFLCFLVSGCGENKYTQCKQIIHVASMVNENNQKLNYSDHKNYEQPMEMKSWLEAAQTMNNTAENIRALSFVDSKLLGYQNKLANVYQIYSQATYEAVKAQESKNIEALETARIEAQKAGKIQQGLVKEINAYCLDN